MSEGRGIGGGGARRGTPVVAARTSSMCALARSTCAAIPIQELIGNVGFVDTIWLMLRGELPSRAQAALLEAALVASVDHGPQAPSIAIARMATTCGARINGAMASAINVLDDIHGGPGQQCMELYLEIDAEAERGRATSTRRSASCSQRRRDAGVAYIPGFGHRFHPLDPRTPRLLSLVDGAAADGVGGRQVRRDRPRGRGRDQRGQAQARAHERRRRDRGDLLRARLHARTRAGRLHPVALRRDPGPRQRADAAGGPDQGPRAEVDRLHVHRVRHADPCRTNATNEGERHEGPGVEPDRPVSGGTRCRAHLRAVRAHEHRAARGAREERAHLLRQRAPRADRGARGRRLRPGDQAGGGRAHPPRPRPDECDHRSGERRTRLDPDGRDRRRRADPLLRQAPAPGDQPPRRCRPVGDLSPLRQARVARRPAAPHRRGARQGVHPRRERTARPVLVDVPMDVFSAEVDVALFDKVLSNTRSLAKPSLDEAVAEQIVQQPHRRRQAGAVRRRRDRRRGRGRRTHASSPSCSRFPSRTASWARAHSPTTALSCWG